MTAPLDRDVQRSPAGRRAQREQVAALVQVWYGRFFLGSSARAFENSLERGTLGQGDADGDGTRKIRNGEPSRLPLAGGSIIWTRGSHVAGSAGPFPVTSYRRLVGPLPAFGHLLCGWSGLVASMGLHLCWWAGLRA